MARPYSLAFTIAVLMVAVSVASEPAAAQEQFAADERAAVEDAVRDALETEQAAFGSGDCETAMSFLSEDLLFVANSRAMNKRAVQAACRGMAANRDRPSNRRIDEHQVVALSATSAYSVTTYAITPAGGGAEADSVPQRVTKVWALQGESWRIVHFHESPPARER